MAGSRVFGGSWQWVYRGGREPQENLLVPKRLRAAETDSASRKSLFESSFQLDQPAAGAAGRFL